tara:strand:+ start:1145 stop:4006 length:2862 start_codon:yes stop_codon:yes gene_type:complete
MSILKERDYGTPAGSGSRQVTVTIDGVGITVSEGTTVMRAAAAAGIDIPRLCATDSLKEFGSCRLCLVEIAGQKGTPASCTTPVRDGMEVCTESERLARLRRGVMELYISDHPLDCLTCSANGDCELQDMAGVVGLRNVRYEAGGRTHLDQPRDSSNPYFTFDPSKCIVCSRCVRACDEIQGTFALTIEGRGFDSQVVAGAKQAFLDSECVSCGACLQVCPTAALMEDTVIERGLGEHTVLTTCAYCGVGCGFKAEMRGEEVIRMVPWKDGKANHGHSCVKGRFAWGYATHKDRITTPLIRDKITDPWRQVGWDEAISTAARRLRDVQDKYGRKSIGAITSSRCTNEEVYVMQKLVRAVFGNNNVDTCARVCHSPTGYGLKQTLGTSAGTQHFDSVMQAEVIMVIGANPTDAHPVFASQMKRRLREGAKLIVIDPRAIDLVRSPHVEATYHLPLRPGTNVALLNALAHVVVEENLVDEKYVRQRCDHEAFKAWREFVLKPENSPEAVSELTGVSAADIRAAARLYAAARKNGEGRAAIYYGLGVTEHSQGSTAVMAMANLAMATGNLGFPGCGVNPLRGQNNVQGSCDMGSFPHELPGYRPVNDAATRTLFEADWGVMLDGEPGLRIPGMFNAAVDGAFKALYIQGEDVAQSDPNIQHVEEALTKLDCLIVQDLFLNETAQFAHVFLPGTSFLEKNGTFINAERRINRVRRAIRPKNAPPGETGLEEWEITCRLARAMGYDMRYDNAAQIMDEIARLTPTFAGVSFRKLDEVGSLQWPCNDAAPEGTEIMHVGGFVRGKGNFVITEFVPTREKTSRRFPLILTTGRILSQYNVGAQTRRTDNNIWHEEDLLEIHPRDAADRNIRSGDRVVLKSRMGETTLRAALSERMQPGVVYTTFHMPETGANVVTTELSDWATNCPEYKVTAVEVRRCDKPASWQKHHEALARKTRRIAE